MDSPTQEQQPPQPSTGDIWLLVLKDMEQRRLHGIDKYGTTVQPNNGRDALTDAYQEALDLCVYLRQAIEEREIARRIMTGMASRVAAQSELLSRRAERKERQ
jgi:hypothetical protein